MNARWQPKTQELNLLDTTPEQILHATQELRTSFDVNQWSDVASFFDSPSNELTISPLSTRIAWLAAQRGAAFSHHELKTAIPMPEHLWPETGSADPAGWHNGALVEPRHFSFGQDHRLQVFHPNHRAQWRAHELAHCLSGFFWHPSLTRFELYLSSRLNELFPVIHWYGWDRIGRHCCPKHVRAETYREHCRECAKLWETPWYEMPPVSESDDLYWAAQGLDHFEREWDAIISEYQTGIRNPTPRGPLDASTDAVGYLDGHWNRSTSWGFGRWVETFLVDGKDYFSDFEHWLNVHLESHNSLFFDALTFTKDAAEVQRERRILQEFGYRTMMALEHLPEDSKEAHECEVIWAPWLDAAHDALTQAAPELESLKQCSTHWLDTLAAIGPWLPNDLQQCIHAIGLRANPRTHNLGQIGHGLEEIGVHADIDEIQNFIQSEQFTTPGFLIERWAAFAPSEETTRAAFFQRACGQDREAELFGTLPDLDQDIPLGELRLNSTSVRRLNHEGQWEYAFSWRGEVRVVTCTMAEHGWIQVPNVSSIPEDLASWLESGLIIWIPPPATRGQRVGL